MKEFRVGYYLGVCYKIPDRSTWKSVMISAVDIPHASVLMFKRFPKCIITSIVEVQ